MKPWWQKPVYLLARGRFDAGTVLVLLERGAVQLGMVLSEEAWAQSLTNDLPWLIVQPFKRMNANGIAVALQE